MKTLFVFDACALIAFFNDETGADVVEDLLIKAELGEIELVINSINVLEIYYGVYREDGLEVAEETLEKIQTLPIKILYTLSHQVFHEAGRLKATYSISLADAIAVAEANTRGVHIVTADHHEFDNLERENVVKVHWIREDKKIRR